MMIETTSKHTAASRKTHTDAWLMLLGFTILSSTFLLTPSAHVVTSSPTTQQNSSAILLLRNQTAAWRVEGRRDDGEHELGVEKETPRANSQTRSFTTPSSRRSCVLSQQVREVRGAVFMCWMIKQEAPEYTKRAIARLLGTGGDQGKGSRHRSSRDSGVHGPVASAIGERQHSGSRKRGGSGKPQANVGRHGTGGGFRFGTSLQAGQSVRPSSEPSRTRHQRGTTPRTHSWGTRTNRSESSSRSSSKRSFGTGTVSSDRTELEKLNFVAASRPD